MMAVPGVLRECSTGIAADSYFPVKHAFMISQPAGFKSIPKTGTTYRDVVMAVSGIGREQALKYKREYGQVYIAAIEKNDAPGFIWQKDFQEHVCTPREKRGAGRARHNNRAADHAYPLR